MAGNTAGGGSALRFRRGKGTLVAEMTSANVSKSDTVTVETVPVSGQPFKECLRVTVPSASKNSWDLRLRAPSSGGFQLGDIGILEFWARKVSGVGKSNASSNATSNRTTSSPSAP